MVLLIDVPSVMYVGVEGTIVVKVSDGFDWVLSVDSTEVDSGTGTGENQDATFTPTAEMEGRSVEVLLTGTGETDEDDTRIIAVYDSAWIDVPAYLYIGEENTVQLRATAGAQWIIYLNDKYATWGIGTGATQSVTLVPTFDYEGLNQDADLRVLSLEDTENTSVVDGYILAPAPVLYVGIEGNLPVRVTKDLIWSMYINGVTAAYTQSGLGADQDCIFIPTAGMEGNTVTASIHWANHIFDLEVTVVDAQIISVPNAVPVDDYGDIYIWVTDGYGWILEVNGIQVADGIGTGENQKVTVGFTQAMAGQHIPVLLTAGEKTDLEYIDDVIGIYNNATIVYHDSWSRLSSTANPFYFDYTCHDGYDRMLIVYMFADEKWGGTCTYGEATLTATDALIHPNAKCWYLLDADFPTAGEHILTVTPNGQNDMLTVHVIELAYVDQSAPAASRDILSDDEWSHLTVNTTVDNSLIISGCVAYIPYAGPDL